MTHVLQSIMHSYTRYWRFMSTSNINGQFIFCLCCGSSFFMFWCFNCCAVCTFYVPFRILIVSGHLLGNSGFLGLRYVLFALVPDCQFSLSDLWFWSGTFVLIAPFPDHCLLLPFHNVIEPLLVSH